jgi:hypothetical protein
MDPVGLLAYEAPFKLQQNAGIQRVYRPRATRKAL